MKSTQNESSHDLSLVLNPSDLALQPLNLSSTTLTTSLNSSNLRKILLLDAIIKMQFNLTVTKSLMPKLRLDHESSLEKCLNIFLDSYCQYESINHPFLSTVSLYQKATSSFKSLYSFQNSSKHKPNLKLKELTKTGESIQITIPTGILQKSENSQKELVFTECQICQDPKASYQMMAIPSSGHSFCEACLEDYLSYLMKAHKILKIKCPDGCGKFLSDDDIKCILSKKPEKWESFRNMKISDSNARNPLIRWCIVPSCNGFVLTEEHIRKVKCGECNQKMCAVCRNEWHEGKTCEQYIKSLFESKIKKVESKSCPKCLKDVEKWGIFNHVVCRNCKFEFCWLCLKESDRRHFKWYNVMGCPDMLFANENQKEKKIEAWAKIIISVLFGVFLVVLLGLPIVVCLGSVGFIIFLIVRCFRKQYF